MIYLWVLQEVIAHNETKTTKAPIKSSIVSKSKFYMKQKTLEAHAPKSSDGNKESVDWNHGLSSLESG